MFSSLHGLDDTGGLLEEDCYVRGGKLFITGGRPYKGCS